MAVLRASSDDENWKFDMQKEASDFVAGITLALFLAAIYAVVVALGAH